jgi:Pyruvate/2-oxoacid:ferredoxin oxidoreductase gamma subunit
MLGALCGSGLTDFEPGTFEETIRDELPTRSRDINLDAFQRGLALGRCEDESFTD